MLIYSITFGAITKDSTKIGYATNAASIVYAHQHHGRVT